MRIYHFGNFYMSSIQQGIQAAHCQTEMAMNYSGTVVNEAVIMYKDWAVNHKTMICLNGGMNIDLEDIKYLMEVPENPYPWSFFQEAEEAMGGMLTNVAIVLPEKIYNLASEIRNRTMYISDGLEVVSIPNQTGGAYMMPTVQGTVTEFERELIMLLNSCGLAK